MAVKAFKRLHEDEVPIQRGKYTFFLNMYSESACDEQNNNKQNNKRFWFFFFF